MEIKGAGIIITGAGAGFGRAMTLHFASLGAKVFALDINENSLESLKNENQEVQTYICDVSDNVHVEKTINQIFEVNSKINVLINNAGIMKNSPLINILARPDKKHPVDLWHKVVEVNQNSVFYMTRSVVEKMIQYRNRGVIINISSISARGNIGQTAYSATKAAVEAMSKVWSKELGRFGIRSVSVAPGFMDTAGTAEAIEEKMLEQWIEKTPLRRTGTIDEVVTSIKFVIENDFITGEVLNINGGLSI